MIKIPIEQIQQIPSVVCRLKYGIVFILCLFYFLLYRQHRYIWVSIWRRVSMQGNINVNAARYSSTFNRYIHTHIYTLTQTKRDPKHIHLWHLRGFRMFFISKTRCSRRELRDPINVISFHRNNSNRLTNPPLFSLSLPAKHFTIGVFVFPFVKNTMSIEISRLVYWR